MRLFLPQRSTPSRIRPLHSSGVLSRLCFTHHHRYFSMAISGTPAPWTTNKYPSARRSDHVDVYKSKAKGEVPVHDPYNWLEHNTEETDKWTTAQEAFTREYLDKNPDRQILEDEIRKNTDYAKVIELGQYLRYHKLTMYLN